MKTWLLLLFLILGFSADGAEVAQILAQGQTLTLPDGRTFQDWSIRQQTASAVFIVSKSGLAKVAKQNLPADLRIQFPFDAAAAAKEAAVIESKIARTEAAQKLREAAKAEDTKEQEYRNRLLVEAQEQARAAMAKFVESAPEREAARKAAHEAELAQSFDGLTITAVTRIPSGLQVTLRNAHENPRLIHRTDLVGLSSKGEVFEAGDVRPMVENESSLSIPGNSSRSFIFRITNWDCRSIQWKDRADLAPFPVFVNPLKHR